ncbi:ribonuclease E inhibitor RraA/Dimethylmenaquinone methyltransferase [Talaromyces proteolyticus]|uniref:Ribonuclease E inhibitor RraA/Dimethylmenaquinone methyltransferase n=1 Tax=Talaromyces proteolyticus TaxID=1131652 RepID=A0AAD4KKG1_9EURO|nr:ribonuclease E inhibitor RraA/Dimethylmenaquinone methyltransferase [Talaromyces proteolyticus]KAH8690553.1 ribonuclease E inhibitor RraA/Dimethylmenaquinone methyltransferase [Talaromyces proteolyticus]
MATFIDPTTQYMCNIIQQEYSACDVSDALLKLHVHAAGFLPDIVAPLLGFNQISRRTVAPVSTLALVPKSWTDSSSFPQHLPRKSNIPQGENWTDYPSPGTIVLVQQPGKHVSAILGDIMITRLHHRGVLGVVADGRIRDVKSCTKIRRNTTFQVWSKGVSAAGPSLEAKPWAIDVPLKIGETWIKPGDFICADEEDQVIVVIPREHLRAVYELLPTLKRASDRVLEDVERGLSLPEAFERNPDFYSNYK